MLVTNLFVKRAHGENLEPVASFDFDENGIVNGVPCSPLRQVLITSRPVTVKCGLNPGDLRENIVVDADELYELPSGTVVAIGSARIRLTFHCEPCKALHKVIEPGRIVHKRGVLGCFLNSGTVSIGDSFSVTEQNARRSPIRPRTGYDGSWAMAMYHWPVPIWFTLLAYLLRMPALCRTFSRNSHVPPQQKGWYLAFSASDRELTITR